MSWIHVCLLFISIWISHLHGQENDDCECTVIYLCNSDTMKTSKQHVINLRETKRNCTYLETCCPKKDIVIDSRFQATSTSKQPSCGIRNLDGVGYRISGNVENEAEFGEFPWVVAILHKNPNEPKYSFKCGGSLIHSQVVLTAAHCVLGGGEFLVRAGEWDTQTTQEVLKYQEQTVESIVIHKNFKKSTLANDVALMILQSPVNISDHINVVCLPPANLVAASGECFVSGWGKDKFEKDGVYQSILKKIAVPLVAHKQCESDFQRTRLGNKFHLHESFICAGGKKGEDACSGDGGGPLVCPVEGQEDTYQQVGIVSWGIGCGNEGVPGAYVNVASFRSWIDERLKKRKFIN